MAIDALRSVGYERLTRVEAKPFGRRSRLRCHRKRFVRSASERPSGLDQTRHCRLVRWLYWKRNSCIAPHPKIAVSSGQASLTRRHVASFRAGDFVSHGRRPVAVTQPFQDASRIDRHGRLRFTTALLEFLPSAVQAKWMGTRSR